MAGWNADIKRTIPDIKLGTYIDDRTLWSSGPGAARRLAAALARVAELEARQC